MKLELLDRMNQVMWLKSDYPPVHQKGCKIIYEGQKYWIREVTQNKEGNYSIYEVQSIPLDRKPKYAENGERKSLGCYRSTKN